MQDIINSSCSHDSSQQNSDRKTNNMNFSIDQQLYSLRELVNIVATSETDTIYVRSNVISTVEHLEPPEQQDICARPKQSDDLRTDKRIQDLNRLGDRTQTKSARKMTFELYELTVRPLQYKDRACYLVQMRQTNSIVRKSLKLAQEVSGSLP